MNQSEQYLKLARQQRSQGNSGLAAQTARKALGLEPDNSQAHVMLAICLYDEYVDKRHFSYMHQALAAAKAGIAVDSGNPMAHYILGMIVMSQGGLALIAAKEHFDQALLLDPNDPMFITALATWYEHNDQTKESIELYEKALSFDPHDTNTLSRVGKFYFDQGDINKAMQYATELLEMAPNSTGAHMLMGEIAYRRNENELAREHISFVLSKEPNDYHALFIMCAILTHKSFLKRNIFRFIVWITRSNKNYLIIFPIVLLICTAISFLPEKMGFIEKDHFYWLILAISIYLVFTPFFFMQKLKRKFLKKTSIRDDF